MLLSQHLCGRKQNRLPTGVDNLQHRPQCQHRFARSHIALQEPVHRRSLGEVAGDRLARLQLSRSQRKRTRCIEACQQPVCDGQAGAGRQRARLVAPLGERRLQDHGLLHLQAQACRFDVGHIARVVDLVKSLVQAG